MAGRPACERTATFLSKFIPKWTISHINTFYAGIMNSYSGPIRGLALSAGS